MVCKIYFCELKVIFLTRVCGGYDRSLILEFYKLICTGFELKKLCTDITFYIYPNKVKDILLQFAK